MKANSNETELERLRAENRRLLELLADQKSEQAAGARENTGTVSPHTCVRPTDAMEQQLRLFDIALSSIMDYVFICDLQGRITYANHARLTFWQRNLDEVLGKTFFELGYAPELAARIHSQIQTVIATREPLHTEAEHTPASGKSGYYDYILVPVFAKDGQVEAVAGSTRDISDRHREQIEKEALLKTLHRERERLTSLFLQAPAFIAILRGPDHRFEMANPAYYQVVGARDLLGKPIRDAFPDLEGQGFFELLDEVYRTGQPFLGKDVQVIFQTGADTTPHEHFIDFIYQPLVEADGSVSGIFVHGVDLTVRKRAEQALSESEERVRLATEAAGLGVWLWEPAADRVIWENERMYEIYGLSSSDPPLTSAQFIAEIVHPDDAAAFARAIAAPLETGEPLYFEGRFRRADGALRWIEFWGRLQPAIGKQPLRVVGTAADITDRKQTQHALQKHTNEIEALNARLHRSMKETHHRVKNNLQVIAALLEIEEGSSRKTGADLGRIKQHIQTLAMIHDILTAQAKDNAFDTSFVHAKTVLDRLIPMLNSSIGGPKIRAEIEDVLLPVQKSAALALLVNESVSNALKHGAREIEIILRVCEPGKENRELHKAQLQISDNGPGFPVGFDPKQASNTGLELIESAAQWDLRGDVRFENRREGGACVIVNFPIVEEASA